MLIQTMADAPPRHRNNRPTAREQRGPDRGSAAARWPSMSQPRPGLSEQRDYSVLALWWRVDR